MQRTSLVIAASFLVWFAACVVLVSFGAHCTNMWIERPVLAAADALVCHIGLDGSIAMAVVGGLMSVLFVFTVFCYATRITHVRAGRTPGEPNMTAQAATL